MKFQRLVVGVTLANFGLLVFQLLHAPKAEAADGVAQVLRGRALEIVDDQGRVRASIVVHPANAKNTMPNGKTQPDMVMLRLIDPNGRPSVKLGTSVHGAGIALGGETDETYATLQSDLGESSLKLTNKAGRQHLIKP